MKLPGKALSQALQRLHITVEPPVQVVEIEDKFYQLGPEAKYTFDEGYVNLTTILPVIVLPFVLDGQVTEDTLARLIAKFSDEDDVFGPEFLATVIVQQSKNAKQPIQYHTEESIAFGDDHLPLIRMEIKRGDALPAGPYFLQDEDLREAWRLYPDDADAFFAPLQPTSTIDGKFSQLNVSGIFGPSLAVAVPSRLYFPKDSIKPLNGMRIAVKDSFDVKGIHTAVSNKSFLKYRAPATETSPAIKELLAKGAILVGKTKMTSFADREFPPSDWIDYHCPFNPRGDGYLVPMGSSSGSAAAVAAYDWLDASLDTDTSGSIRFPATAQGIFGLRSSHGAISTKAVIPLVPRFDVVGFMARDIHKMQRLAKELLPNQTLPEGEVKFPKKLITGPLTHLGLEGLPQTKILFREFVAQLSRFLGVDETRVDFEREWTSEDPMGTGNAFEKEFWRTYQRIHCAAIHQYQSGWADDYAKMFGKAPYLPPALKNLWPHGRITTPDKVASAWAKVDGFKAWLESKYLSADEETASSAIMVECPAWDITYRDDLSDSPSTDHDLGFGLEYVPSFCGAPELVFCIGQYEYESEISQTTEYAPVAVSIVGAKGSDRMLLKLAEEFLAFTGRPATVLAGKTAFPAEDHRLPSGWEL